MYSLTRFFMWIALIVFAPAALAGGNVDMKQMQQMQACMAKIDQSRLEAISARAEAMNREIKALCDAGKRDVAQNKAIEYGKEISSAPVMQEMQKCGEMAKGMMQQMPLTQEDYADRHVCDSM